MSDLHQFTVDATNELVSARNALVNIISDMNADSLLAGDWKAQIMAWLDLVRQYLVQVTDSGIGQAAATGINTFMNSLNNYETNSTVYPTLNSVLR
jgi:hypothetical protein